MLHWCGRVYDWLSVLPTRIPFAQYVPVAPVGRRSNVVGAVLETQAVEAITAPS